MLRNHDQFSHQVLPLLFDLLGSVNARENKRYLIHKHGASVWVIIKGAGKKHGQSSLGRLPQCFTASRPVFCLHSSLLFAFNQNLINRSNNDHMCSYVALIHVWLNKLTSKRTNLKDKNVQIRSFHFPGDYQTVFSHFTDSSTSVSIQQRKLFSSSFLTP